MTKFEISDLLIEKVEELKDAAAIYNIERIKEIAEELENLYDNIRDDIWKGNN